MAHLSFLETACACAIQRQCKYHPKPPIWRRHMQEEWGDWRPLSLGDNFLVRAPTPSVSLPLHTAPDYHLLLQLRDPGNFTRKPSVWLTEIALSFRQVWCGWAVRARRPCSGATRGVPMVPPLQWPLEPEPLRLYSLALWKSWKSLFLFLFAF